MSPSPDIRWKQRFQSFQRGLILLRKAMSQGGAELNELEREGALGRFKYCLELAWNTAKDYLEESGVVIVPLHPRQVIEEALAARLIDDAQVWFDMLRHRNKLSHTFDCAVFEEAVEALSTRYLPAMERLHVFFAAHEST